MGWLCLCYSIPFCFLHWNSMLVTHWLFKINGYEHKSLETVVIPVFITLYKISRMSKSCCVPGHAFNTRKSKSQVFTLPNPKTEPERKVLWLQTIRCEDASGKQCDPASSHTPIVMCVANAS